MRIEPPKVEPAAPAEAEAASEPPAPEPASEPAPAAPAEETVSRQPDNSPIEPR
jgi:hypothetical protein